MRRKNLVEMARIALESGNLEEAVSHCDRALEEDVDDGWANFLKALALLRQCGPGWTARAARQVFSGVEWKTPAPRSAADLAAAGRPEPASPPEPGATQRAGAHGVSIAGKYELRRKIGEGGMGLVYEALDAKLKRPVAIKKMRPELGINQRDKARLISEARTAAALHHDHIVQIYDIIEEGGEVYLVFEFLEGPTLAKVLEDENKVPWERLRPWLRCVLEALSFAHGQGVVHRDIKPSNIMLSGRHSAKVMDFGIAARAKETVSRVTGVETSGTAAYMAPEQQLGDWDARSDLFALAAAAYELLCGDLPFPGPAQNYYLQKEKMAFKPLAQLAPEVPADVAAAIERCLRFEPAARFQSADDFARALGVSHG